MKNTAPDQQPWLPFSERSRLGKLVAAIAAFAVVAAGVAVGVSACEPVHYDHTGSVSITNE